MLVDAVRLENQNCRIPVTVLAKKLKSSFKERSQTSKKKILPHLLIISYQNLSFQNAVSANFFLRIASDQKVYLKFFFTFK